MCDSWDKIQSCLVSKLDGELLDFEFMVLYLVWQVGVPKDIFSSLTVNLHLFSFSLSFSKFELIFMCTHFAVAKIEERKAALPL